jgi:hypothetical protein
LHPETTRNLSWTWALVAIGVLVLVVGVIDMVRDPDPEWITLAAGGVILLIAASQRVPAERKGLRLVLSVTLILLSVGVVVLAFM